MDQIEKAIMEPGKHSVDTGVLVSSCFWESIVTEALKLPVETLSTKRFTVDSINRTIRKSVNWLLIWDEDISNISRTIENTTTLRNNCKLQLFRNINDYIASSIILRGDIVHDPSTANLNMVSDRLDINIYCARSVYEFRDRFTTGKIISSSDKIYYISSNTNNIRDETLAFLNFKEKFHTDWNTLNMNTSLWFVVPRDNLFDCNTQSISFNLFCFSNIIGYKSEWSSFLPLVRQSGSDYLDFYKFYISPYVYRDISYFKMNQVKILPTFRAETGHPDTKAHLVNDVNFYEFLANFELGVSMKDTSIPDNILGLILNIYNNVTSTSTEEQIQLISLPSKTYRLINPNKENFCKIRIPNSNNFMDVYFAEGQFKFSPGAKYFIDEEVLSTPSFLSYVSIFESTIASICLHMISPSFINYCPVIATASTYRTINIFTNSLSFGPLIGKAHYDYLERFEKNSHFENYYPQPFEISNYIDFRSDFFKKVILTCETKGLDVDPKDINSEEPLFYISTSSLMFENTPFDASVCIVDHPLDSNPLEIVPTTVPVFIYQFEVIPNQITYYLENDMDTFAYHETDIFSAILESLIQYVKSRNDDDEDDSWLNIDFNHLQKFKITIDDYVSKENPAKESLDGLKMMFLRVSSAIEELLELRSDENMKVEAEDIGFGVDSVPSGVSIIKDCIVKFWVKNVKNRIIPNIRTPLSPLDTIIIFRVVYDSLSKAKLLDKDKLQTRLESILLLLSRWLQKNGATQLDKRSMTKFVEECLNGTDYAKKLLACFNYNDDKFIIDCLNVLMGNFVQQEILNQ